MTDPMRERLAKLDPMHSGVPTETTTSRSSQELLEKIMSTQLEEQTRPEEPKNRRTWTIAVAAVAALVLAVASGLALNNGGANPTAVEEPLELTAGADDPMASCIMFSPEELDRVAEIAFAGTVTAVDGETVTLSVDEWYRGEEASEVILTAPAGMEALIGGIPFEAGNAYLISAQDGTVNYCGFSGPMSPELQAGFESAFTGS